MAEEFDLNGVTYRLAKLDAMTQFHVARRMATVMGAMGSEDTEGVDPRARIFEAVGHLSDADSEYVIGKCLSGCRRQNGDTWAKVYSNGRLMFEDIGMAGMIKLTFETLRENLAGFFPGQGLGSPPAEI